MKKPFPLDTKTEGELATKWQTAKDLKARDQLVASVYDWIQHEADRLARPSTPAEDLFQEGVLGAMRAADDFDPQRGTRFIVHARNWVKHYMIRAIGKSRTLLSGTTLRRGKGKDAENERLKTVRTETISLHEGQTGHGKAHGARSFAETVRRTAATSLEVPFERGVDCQKIETLIEAARLTEEEQFVIRARYLTDDEPIPSLGTVAAMRQRSYDWALAREQRAMKKLRKVAA